MIRLGAWFTWDLGRGWCNWQFRLYLPQSQVLIGCRCVCRVLGNQDGLVDAWGMPDCTYTSHLEPFAMWKSNILYDKVVLKWITVSCAIIVARVLGTIMMSILSCDSHACHHTCQTDWNCSHIQLANHIYIAQDNLILGIGHKKIYEQMVWLSRYNLVNRWLEWQMVMLVTKTKLVHHVWSLEHGWEPSWDH